VIFRHLLEVEVGPSIVRPVAVKAVLVVNTLRVRFAAFLSVLVDILPFRGRYTWERASTIGVLSGISSISTFTATATLAGIVISSATWASLVVYGGVSTSGGASGGGGLC
jgi:hypothetical protein